MYGYTCMQCCWLIIHLTVFAKTRQYPYPAVLPGFPHLLNELPNIPTCLIYSTNGSNSTESDGLPAHLLSCTDQVQYITIHYSVTRSFVFLLGFHWWIIKIVLYLVKNAKEKKKHLRSRKERNKMRQQRAQSTESKFSYKHTKNRVSLNVCRCKCDHKLLVLNSCLFVFWQESVVLNENPVAERTEEEIMTHMKEIKGKRQKVQT